MDFRLKAMGIIIIAYLALSQASLSVAQEARENPYNIPAGSGYNIDGHLKVRAEYMLNFFELSTKGVNSSNITFCKDSMFNMNRSHSYYLEKLGELNDPGSDYSYIEASLGDILDTSWLIASEMADNYHTYKALKIFESRGDSDSYNASVQELLESSADIDDLADDIEANASVIKQRMSNVESYASHLNNGVANIRYYARMVRESITNPDIGLETDYSIYNGNDTESLQQIYDYMADMGRPVPYSIAKYVEPLAHVPINITINASNLAAYYGDVIAVKGTVYAGNATPVNHSRVFMLFNDTYYTGTTDEHGNYSFNISIDRIVNASAYNITTIARPIITRDTIYDGNQSPILIVTFLPADPVLALNYPRTPFMAGDTVTVNGTLLTANGSRIADSDVRAFIRYLRPGTQTATELYVGNNTTDASGSYNISFRMPGSVGQDSCTVYTAFYPPGGTVLNATVSNKAPITVRMAEPLFSFVDMPILYFQDDIIGVRGHIVLPNGYNASGLHIDASLSGDAFDADVTDDDGRFTVSHVVAPGDSPGLKTITLWTSGNGGTVSGNKATLGTIVVLPFDKTIFLLTVIAALLSAPVLAITTKGAYDRYAWTWLLRLAMPPRVKMRPRGLPGFSEEMDSMEALAQSGRYRDVVRRAYALSLQIAVERGITPDDASPVYRLRRGIWRLFFKPPVQAHATIATIYEKMTGDGMVPVKQDATITLDCLRVLQKFYRIDGDGDYRDS